MSWMEKLCETYDSSVPGEGEIPLLPIAHTTQTAHVEIYLNGNGDLLDMRLTEKESRRTIIPCTEDSSSGRTSTKVAPHPLCDNLEYVASDLQKYLKVGPKNEKKYEQLEAKHKKYMLQLKAWCADEEYSDKKLRVILSYVEKGTITHDMIQRNILTVDANKKLIGGIGGDESIHKDMLPEKAFVKWFVETDTNSDVSMDRSIWKKWGNYYLKKIVSSEMVRGLDIVTGKDDVPIASKHSAKIRNDGDFAKIISSNDNDGFTYRGRFTSAEQACTISYDTTQKAHQALRWLLRKQGTHQGDWSFVVWSTRGENVLNPLLDPFGIYDVDPNDHSNNYTAETMARELNKRLVGINRDVNTKHIAMMTLDSATPGRLSITYYREFDGSEYSEHMNNWFDSYAWYRNRKQTGSGGNSKGNRSVEYVCPPSIKNIVESAYGKNVDDSLKKHAFSRLVPCIIEGRSVPPDIISSVFNRASNPMAFKKEEKYEWNDILSTACALYRGTNKKGEYTMSLDKNRRTRSYLYGRLLAVANELEGKALYLSKEERQTNAMRMMQKFSERPFSTWKIIYEALAPYKARVGYAWYYDNVISEIMESFDVNDFTDNKKLDGEYILAFYTQTKELRSKNDKKEE